MIALVLAAWNYFMGNIVRTLYMRRLEEESLNYASIYSHSLVKSREAYRAVDDLLEERLLSATNTAVLFLGD